MVTKQIYDYEYMKKILNNLHETKAQEEFTSITKNLIYFWKNSKKRGKKLLVLLESDLKQHFYDFFVSSIKNDLKT